MNQKITKNKLRDIISRKISHKVHRIHILSIINILIDEMIKELKSGKDIKILGLGTFSLNDLKSKKIINVVSKKIKFTKRTKSLRFRLSKSLSKYLLKGNP
jgi:nucleoid DNA-binding protein